MKFDKVNPSTDHGDGAGGGGASAREQVGLLISRIADGEACGGDWEAFGALAQRFPDAWQELATAQRAYAALSVAVGVAIHAADRVELPSAQGARGFNAGGSGFLHGERLVVWSRVRAWGGWAAAAVLVLAWSGGGFRAVLPQRPGNAQQATIVPAGWQLNTPDDAVNAYLDLGAKAGSVMGEMPQRVMIDARPAAGGAGVEVTYLRQFIEKRTYKDMVKFAASDEAGQSRPVPYTPEPSPEASQ